MSDKAMTAREVRDRADFKLHPEWFEAVPLYGVGPALVATLPLMSQELREEALWHMSNPPLSIRRKPIPFVLPINGSAL